MRKVSPSQIRAATTSVIAVRSSLSSPPQPGHSCRWIQAISRFDDLLLLRRRFSWMPGGILYHLYRHLRQQQAQACGRGTPAAPTGSAARRWSGSSAGASRVSMNPRACSRMVSSPFSPIRPAPALRAGISPGRGTPEASPVPRRWSAPLIPPLSCPPPAHRTSLLSLWRERTAPSRTPARAGRTHPRPTSARGTAESTPSRTGTVPPVPVPCTGC